MTDRFRLTIAQLNATVGALAENAEKARKAWAAGKAAGADFVALPEMFLTGYQTQDLVQKPAFLDDVDRWLDWLTQECADGPALGIGAPWRSEGKLHNTYVVLHNGAVAERTVKYFLPNYTVFEEVRLFSRGAMQDPVQIAGASIGMPVCEDAWYPDVTRHMADAGAGFFVVPNGSPYFRDKQRLRHEKMAERVAETARPLVYINLVGAQDDQVFDGGSFVLNAQGDLTLQLPLMEEAVAHVDFERSADVWSPVSGPVVDIPDTLEQDYHAMVLALRDYMGKTGFSKVLLGLSGGIDSALVAAIAADALGPDNVRGVMMPSEYTSQASLDDAAGVAKALGIGLDTVPIGEARAAVTKALAPLFQGLEADLTEENIQSRLRGLLLMAQSNKFGEMLLTTGNKSEVAVGYATIYGDMAGGYNPIKDLYKTRVFKICRWRNAHHLPWMKGPEGTVISPSIIEKPPSAELRADQKDSDSLPDYATLDDILERLVDRDQSVAEVVEAGHDREVVKKVEHLLYISEYKRFQSAPGPRLSMRAFWLDRRYPIVNRWRDPS